MGIDIVTASFLVFCRKSGVDFSNSATLGRQSLYLDRRDLLHLFEKAGISCSSSEMDAILRETSPQDLKHGFAEAFFRSIGAQTVDSIDASDYEGATIIHDMNTPIPEMYHGKFSALLDGGALEHIFNFPVAAENCMKMLKKGGSFISVAPANNYFGHGFYQFSSELFFRVFCSQNGFRVIRAFVCAEKTLGTWFEVPDPASLGERITITNQVPTLQLFAAEKISNDAGLHVVPQQSDYSDILWKGTNSEAWTAHGEARQARRLAANRRLAGYLPYDVAYFLKALRPLVMGGIKPPFQNRNLRRFRP